MLASSAEVQAGGAFRELADERGYEDFAATGERGDARGDDDMATEEVVFLIEGLARMQTDAQADWGLDLGGGALDGNRARQRAARWAKATMNESPAVLISRPLWRVICFPHEPVVFSQQVHEELVAQAVKEQGGVFDVAEQHGGNAGL